MQKKNSAAKVPVQIKTYCVPTINAASGNVVAGGVAGCGCGAGSSPRV